MPDASSPITGACLCGACRYSTTAKPINSRACHCKCCQRATGAPLYARVMVPLDQVSIRGPVSWWDNTETGLQRGFCSQCGSTLFSARPAANTVGLTHGTLDEPHRHPPTEQIWTDARQPWLSGLNDLPGFAQGPG